MSFMSAVLFILFHLVRFVSPKRWKCTISRARRNLMTSLTSGSSERRSINTEAIYHHCYEFGTTGVFVCMGKPIPNFLTGEYNKKIMPLGIVMDERICTGHEYALFWQTLRRYLKHQFQYR